MPDDVKIFVSRVNFIGGDPSVLGTQEDLDRLGAETLLPPLSTDLWSRIRDFGPIRRQLLQSDEERMLLRYARTYIRTYREFVGRHVPDELKEKFAFRDSRDYGFRVVYSREHGAAVIFDPGQPNRFRATVVDGRIEHIIWPRTALPWSGVKTTFRGEHFAIFIPGKGLYAARGLTILYTGVLVYESRMVLKGNNSAEEWSPAAACFDALHTFMRVAREITADQIALKKIMDQGDLEIRARAAALVRASGGADQITGDPWAHYSGYFALADQLGINRLVATQRLQDIIQEIDAPTPEDLFRERWIRPVTQNVLGGVVFVVLGVIVGLLISSVWAGLGAIVAAAVIWKLIRRGSDGRSGMT